MGVVNTTNTFTATDTITSTKMNDIIDQTTFTDDAVFDTTLAVAAGKLKVKAQGITSNELADGSVLTGKIVDANVTTAKIANSNITTDKIANSNITTDKIADASITAAKLNGMQTGIAPIYGCRAWGSFDGSAATPITPSSAGNISSIVRLATASYRITFAIAMTDSDYAVSFSNISVLQSNQQAFCAISLTAKTTLSFDFELVGLPSVNPTLVTFMVIR